MAFGAILNQNDTDNYFTKSETITPDIIAILGLSENATPADAFLALSLGENQNGFSVYVKTPKGNPVPNATVSGIQTLTGEACITNENGYCFGVSTSQTVSFDVTSPYYDLANGTTKKSRENVVTNVDIVLPVKTDSNFGLFTSNATVKFSPDVVSLDWYALGGGGSGGAGTAPENSDYKCCGTGGGSGYATNLKNYTNIENNFTIQIGKGGSSSASLDPNTNAGEVYSFPNGGNSSIQANSENIVVANGGEGGKGVSYENAGSNYVVAGGTGGADGGGLNSRFVPVNGETYSGDFEFYYGFSDSTKTIPSPGGGGAAVYRDGYNRSSSTEGGTTGGGNGDYTTVESGSGSGGNATSYGAGGGGYAWKYGNYKGKGGSGYTGCVGVVIHY